MRIWGGYEIKKVIYKAKLNNKLKAWWTISFDDFKKEIKKQFKQEMTLAQSIEWQDMFNQTKTTIQTQSAELAAKEQQLNQPRILS